MICLCRKILEANNRMIKLIWKKKIRYKINLLKNNTVQMQIYLRINKQLILHPIKDINRTASWIIIIS